MDSQCMYIGMHERAKRIINHAMTADPAVAGELVRHDFDVEVPFALTCACMTNMQMALVLNKQLSWIECGAEKPFNGRNAIAHSEGFLSICCASQIDCATTNTNVRLSNPKSLNLTQAASEKL